MALAGLLAAQDGSGGEAHRHTQTDRQTHTHTHTHKDTHRHKHTHRLFIVDSQGSMGNRVKGGGWESKLQKI
eukprot:2695069-Pyramimonas_sp.AAC.1